MSHAESDDIQDAPPEGLRERAQELREQLDKADGELRELVQEHPIAAVAGAVICGYLIGRLVARL